MANPFYAAAGEVIDDRGDAPSGWYVWTCDASEPSGPFDTEAEAIEAAKAMTA